MSEVDSTENKVAMDEVAEKRPDVNKKGFVGTIIFLVIIGGIAGAGWYFQSMWLPQVQQKYQQAQTMMHDFMSPKKVDPMAAPMSHAMEESDDDGASEPVASAIVEPVEITEPVAAVVEEVVTETAPPETDTKQTDDVEDNQVESVTAKIEETAEVVETKPAEIEKTVEVESVAKATFIPEEVVEAAAVEHEAVTIPKTDTAEKPVPMTPKKAADLAQARQAFWQRDLVKAEALYKQQIETAKPDANSWGELGNIYYLQAKWKQAAAAYTEAALLLLEKGDFPQAMFMRYIITGLDPAQARRIDERLKALQAPLNG